MSNRTAGTWAGIVLATSLTGCASTGAPSGMSAARPTSVPTRANPNPTGFAAGNNSSGPMNASAWNTHTQNRGPVPIVNPTGNSPTTAVPPNGSIQPVSGIAPPMPNSGTLTPPTPVPNSAPVQGSLLPNSPSLKNLNGTPETALKAETNQLAANVNRADDITRTSIPSPRFDEPLPSQSPPLPVPAAMEIASPTPPATNGLTVQPVLMNPQPTTVRPQKPN
jgi:hypothetical protein